MDMEITKTGIKTLDEMLGSGLPKASLALIASRPGMGKTTLALQIAGNMAKSGKKVLLFSLEMSENTVRNRITKQTVFEVKNNITIDETAPVGIDYICNKVASTETVDAVIIDYFQLIKEKEPKHEHTDTKWGEISTALKSLVKTSEIPFIVTSQLNRFTNDRLSMMNSVRETGTLQQDADIIIFPYQETFYPEHTDTSKKYNLIIAKNRYGETGEIPVLWNPEKLIFEE